MKTLTVKDQNGVIHHYNPQYIKDMQEVKNEYNNEWCVNLIIDDDKEPLCAILFKSLPEKEHFVATALTAMESIQ